jgi:hypothetical protein
MTLRTLVLAASLSLCASLLNAQEQPRLRVDIEPGTRIRVTTAEQRLDGEMIGSRDGSIVLRRQGTDVAVPHAAVRVLEGRGGRDRMRGARWGALILASVTTVGATIDVARGQVGAGEIFSALLGGVLAGGAIGALVAPVGWERIWTGEQQRFTTSLGPNPPPLLVIPSPERNRLDPPPGDFEPLTAPGGSGP